MATPKAFTGKPTFLPYAPDTSITFVVPNGFTKGEVCLIYWQWAAAAPNVTNAFPGLFTKTSPYAVQIECKNYCYWFVWQIETNEVQMMREKDQRCGEPFVVVEEYLVCVFWPGWTLLMW